jgi:uncharacterized protein
MKDSFIDTGMKSVVMKYDPNEFQMPSNKIDLVNIESYTDHNKEVENTGHAPIGAGFGTRGTTKQFDGKFHDISMINVLLTKKCNFRCDYCVEDKDLPDEIIWHRENFDALIQWLIEQDTNQIKNGGRIILSFFGGEPLLEWDSIKEFITYALEEYGDIIAFNISTNIVLLDDKKLQWIEENTKPGDLYFLLSLDGFERVFSRHATGNKKNNLMSTIRKNLDNMKENYNGLFKKSSFRVSALPEYLDILCEDLYEMVDYGPENIIIHPVTTEPNAPWTLEKYKKLEDTINDLCYYAIETSNVEIECMEGVSKKTHNCGAGHSMLAVNADGAVYSCYFTAHAEMKDDILANFLDDSVYHNRANVYQLNPNYDPKCASCDKT